MTGLALLDAPFAHHGRLPQRGDTASAGDAADGVAVVADVHSDLAGLEGLGHQDPDDRLGGAPSPVLLLPFERLAFGSEFVEFRARRCPLFVRGHLRMIPRQVVTWGGVGGSPVTVAIPDYLLIMPHHVATIVGVQEIGQTEGTR